MIYLSISDRIWVAIVPVPILTHPMAQALKKGFFGGFTNESSNIKVFQKTVIIFLNIKRN